MRLQDRVVMQPLGDWEGRWLSRNMVVWGGKEVSAYPTSPGRLKLREATSARSGCRRIGVGLRKIAKFLTQMGAAAGRRGAIKKLRRWRAAAAARLGVAMR